MRDFDMTGVSKPIFVMAFVAAMIVAAALLLSTMINSAERPIETGADLQKAYAGK